MRAESKPSSPKAFGPYTVYERLGVGGMATVHRAEIAGTGGKPTVVALKRLLPHLAEDEAFVRAFIQEARLSSLLRHPNIISLHELGRVSESYFMSMEFVDGRDLRKCLRQARRAAGPPPIAVVLSIARQICDALDYAHRLVDERERPLGLVHRDISPSNILIAASGDVKLIDFGIAKATAQQTSRSGAIKGKLAYMAPEALRGNPDARCDLFSTGVIVHELLTARPLFADKNDFKIIERIETLDPPPPSRFNRKCPPELDAFCLRALAKSPDARWRSGAEMIQAIDAMADGYRLQLSSRGVAEWTAWAFALPVPDRPAAKFTEQDSSVDSLSFPTSPGSGPTGVEIEGPVESFLGEIALDDALAQLDIEPTPAMRAPTERGEPNPAASGLVTFRPPTIPPPAAEPPRVRPPTVQPPTPAEAMPPPPRRPGRPTGTGVRRQTTPPPDVLRTADSVPAPTSNTRIAIWCLAIVAVIAAAVAIATRL